jgi:hypothetical protein
MAPSNGKSPFLSFRLSHANEVAVPAKPSTETDERSSDEFESAVSVSQKSIIQEEAKEPMNSKKRKLH